MRTLAICSLLLILNLGEATVFGDDKGLQKLKGISESFKDFQSSKLLPENTERISISVQGSVSETLREVPGEVKGAFHSSGDFSYFKSTLDKEEQAEIFKKVADGLGVRLEKRVKIDDKSAWRLIVFLQGYGTGGRLVRIGGGRFRPQDNYQVDSFIVNSELKSLVYHRSVSFSANSTESVLTSIFQSTADDVANVLKLKEIERK